jgi:hypothetical protein
MENDDFTVQDRRRTDAQPSEEDPSGHPPANDAERATPQDVDFSTFILSLATSAQMCLGAIPHPETNATSLDLPAAKQMIDLLAMLQHKTKGNLSKDEDELLDRVLSTLRMHYVRVAAEEKKSGES